MSNLPNSYLLNKMKGNCPLFGQINSQIILPTNLNVGVYIAFSTASITKIQTPCILLSSPKPNPIGSFILMILSKLFSQ